ncbi:MAG: adenosylcobinamide-GDP ribazoletransferase [Acetivibrio sp.]
MKRWFKGLVMSFSMFSILPMPRKIWEESAANLLIPFYPLVGLAFGGIWYGCSILFSYMEVPIALKTVILMILPALLSGFLHMDGYMDTMDAIHSRRSMEEKKRILKDSHVGAFAVIYFGLWLFLSYAAVYSIVEGEKNTIAFLWIPFLSRAITGFFVLTEKPMWENGYLLLYRKEAKKIHKILPVFYIGVISLGLLLGGVQKMWFIFFALIGTAIVSEKYLIQQFDGISGDLSGCILTLSELGALLVFALI